MIVIGLTGLAGAGKSTAADYLVQAHGFTRLSFAAPLKKMLRTLDPIVGSQLVMDGQVPGPLRVSYLFEKYSDEARIKTSVWGPEYRRLLQVLGTDCIRAEDPDFWVRAALKQLKDPKGKYVFDDCRFPNEGKSLQGPFGLGTGTLWNIERPGLVRGDHDSEQHAGYMGEEYFIANDGVPALLCRRIDAVLNEMGRG